MCWNVSHCVCVRVWRGEGVTVFTDQPALSGSIHTPHRGPPLGYSSDLRVHTLADAVHPQDSGPEEEAHTGSGHSVGLSGQAISEPQVHQGV